MSKKKLVAICVCIFATVLLNIFIFKKVNINRVETIANTLKIEMMSDFGDIYQVYYSQDGEFSEENSSSYDYEKMGERIVVDYYVSLDNSYIRLDFGNQPGNIDIYSLSYDVLFKDIELEMSMFDNPISSNGIVEMSRDEHKVHIVTEGQDPYLVFKMNNAEIYSEAMEIIHKISVAVDIIFCVLIDIMVLICLKYIGKLATLPIELFHDRRLIWNLSKNDFKTKFAGSYLGIIWAFVQPIVTVAVYWFVFEIGLRAGRMCDYPFVLWLMAGLVPWFFFSEALNGGTNALLEYNYLVKKVVFKISILPVVKVTSSIFVHLFFIAFIIGLCWFYGYTPDLYTLQIVYYVICSFVFVLGLSYMTSAVVGFFKDLTQIINILLQVGMWVTPIMWDPVSVLSSKLQIIFKLNPMYYIVDGFRDALLGKIWFWDKPIWTCYFWIIMIALFGLGVTVFKKLRVHFADVL